MRVVKLRWNQKVNENANYSIETEVIVEDDADARQAGKQALAFLDGFQNGMQEVDKP